MRRTRSHARQVLCSFFLTSIVILAGCQSAAGGETPAPATPTVVPATSTPLPAPTATPAPQYPTQSGIPYAGDGHRKQQLDVYVPEGVDGPVATLLVIHGLDIDIDASIITNKPRNANHELAQHFAEQGYAVVLADYRYPSEPWEQYMAQDAFCALAWVHANAETYGFDPRRIAVFGEHFGAFVAAKLGTVDDPAPFLEACPNQLQESNRISGVVTYAGTFFTPEDTFVVPSIVIQFERAYQLISDVPYKEMLGMMEALYDIPAQEWRSGEALDERSQSVASLLPLYWANDGDPPFVLIRGQKDPQFAAVGAQRYSDEFASAMQAVGVDAEVVLLPDTGYFALNSLDERTKVYEAIQASLSDLFG